MTAVPIQTPTFDNDLDGEDFSVRVRDAQVVSQALASDALAVGRAYVSGALDMEGNIESAYRRIRELLGPRNKRASASVPPPPSGPRHVRDREQVNSHYDLPVQFWLPWLGESLLYTCAYYDSPSGTLEQAQQRKLGLICQKLRLKATDTLLEIGCGWGALSLHAARSGARVVGVTMSELQADYARERIARAGLSERATILVCDYRELTAQRFDKIAAIGVSEHLGADFSSFFDYAFHVLNPGGLFLNQGIVHSPQAQFLGGREFVEQYIFPGALLRTVSEVVGEAERAALEVLDVESLSAHYVLTLREWLRRFEANEAEVKAWSDERRYREFRAYLAGFACEFDLDSLRVYQTLMQKPSGASRETDFLKRAYAP